MEINAGLVLGLAGVLSGAIIAALAMAMSRAPGWQELRSFALVAAVASAYCLFSLVHVLNVPEPAHMMAERLGVAFTALYGFAWVRHLAVVDGRPLGWLGRATLATLAIMAATSLIPGATVVPPLRTFSIGWFGVTYTVASGTTLALVCVAFTFSATLGAAFGRGRRWRDGWHARLPMLSAAALVVTGVSDTLASLELIPMPQLIEGMTVGVVGVMGASYVRRFVDDARRLEALSTRLEQEVESRTRELAKAQELAAQHERLAGLGRLAAGVAHEINNPATVIQLNLRRVRALVASSGTLTDEVARRLDRTRAATERIAVIVRQLLDTGRGGDPGAATAFPIGPVVERAVMAATAIHPGMNVIISTAAAPYARGHAALLEQVLINLLVNAAHATRQAPGGGRIRIEATRVGERVRLGVRDNGPGIAAELVARVFEPFTTTKPIGQGTGLGLAVSRGLMSRQGGTLYVASTSSDGTEMALELPAAESADPVSPAAAPAQPRQNRLHVLVIDDDDDLREALRLQLEETFRVDDAGTVDQALALVTAGAAYDAVLCDLMMPTGGAESWLARCAAADPKLGERTIILTAGPTTASAVALVEARRDKVLFKPLDLAQVLPMIDRIGSR